MAAKVSYVCSSCGYESGKWYGKCPDCGAWNSFSEVVAKETKKSPSVIEIASESAPTPISKIKTSEKERISTGFEEFNRVLGGGVVTGSVVLLSGDPGVGKSTILLSLAASFSKRNKKVLYVSGEESESQVKLRAARIGIKDSENLYIFSSGDIDQVIAHCDVLSPDLLIVDSIQTMASGDYPGFAGSLPQIRHATSRLVSFGKKNNVPVFIVGHVTKEGSVAGPMLLSHMVDCVMYLEGETSAGASGTRVLRAFKNRFGDTSEVGIFMMAEEGLTEINDSRYFMGEEEKVPGSCLTVIMEGSRPIIVEIQALVVPTNLSFARRVASGISEKRLELLLAVIQKHAKLPLDRFDIYVNVVGGLNIRETASDLAVVLACVSSYKNKPLGQTIAVGELGLLGDLKEVVGNKSRVKEAKKLGFKTIITSEKYKNLNDIIKNPTLG